MRLPIPTMETVKLHSRAKINLTLDVSRLRPDGYHDIDSIAQVIDLSDELQASPADESEIAVRVEAGDAPADKSNLVCRAGEVFFAQTGIRGGVKFALKKRIPAQAGLGGGSGNAASAIAALNRLYSCELSRDDMCELAAKVGSDAALFIIGGTVRMRGRGDIVEPLPDAPILDIVVVKPSVGVSTAWAYAELDKSQRLPGNNSDAAEQAIRLCDKAALIASLSNDFDPIVSTLVPEIAIAKRHLMDTGAEVAMLSGSGSAVFGVFKSNAAAREAASALSKNYVDVFACRTLARRECELV